MARAPFALIVRSVEAIRIHADGASTRKSRLEVGTATAAVSVLALRVGSASTARSHAVHLSTPRLSTPRLSARHLSTPRLTTPRLNARRLSVMHLGVLRLVRLSLGGQRLVGLLVFTAVFHALCAPLARALMLVLARSVVHCVNGDGWCVRSCAKMATVN